MSADAIFLPYFASTFGETASKLLPYLSLQESFRVFRVGIHHDQVPKTHVQNARLQEWLSCAIARTYPVWNHTNWNTNATIFQRKVPMLLEEAVLCFYDATSEVSSLGERLTDERVGKVPARELPSGTNTLDYEERTSLLETLRLMSIQLQCCYLIGRHMMRLLHACVASRGGCVSSDLERVKVLFDCYAKTKKDLSEEFVTAFRCQDTNEMYQLLRQRVVLPYPIHIGTLKQFWFKGAVHAETSSYATETCDSFICENLISLYQIVVFLLLAVDKEEATLIQRASPSEGDADQKGYAFQGSASLDDAQTASFKKALSEECTCEDEDVTIFVHEGHTHLLVQKSVSISQVERAWSSCADGTSSMSIAMTCDWHTSSTQVLNLLRNINITHDLAPLRVGQKGNNPFFNVHADFPSAPQWIQELGAIRTSLWIDTATSPLRHNVRSTMKWQRDMLGKCIASYTRTDTPRGRQGKKQTQFEVARKLLQQQLLEWLNSMEEPWKHGQLTMRFPFKQPPQLMQCFDRSSDHAVMTCRCNYLHFQSQVGTEEVDVGIVFIPSTKVSWIQHPTKRHRTNDEVPDILLHTIQSHLVVPKPFERCTNEEEVKKRFHTITSYGPELRIFLYMLPLPHHVVHNQLDWPQIGIGNWKSKKARDLMRKVVS